MPHAPNTKLKVPHGTRDIQALEDQLARIAQELRDIRTKMDSEGLESVELKAGTFKHYLSFLETNVKDFTNAFEKALVPHKAAKLRKEISEGRKIGKKHA
jgi:ClpP class serine protease